MPTTIITKYGTTAPTTSDVVQGELAVDTTNKRLYTQDGSSVIELGTNPAADVTFGDNVKAVFGAGSDLQIYHDASNSYVRDAGAGNLIMGAGAALLVKNAALNENLLTAYQNGAVTLYYDNAEKLETTSTGIDVTGTVTADGLTVDGSATIQASSSPALIVKDTTNNAEARLQAFNSTATVGTQSNHSFSIETNDTNRALFASNGDISFYEDTGTTAKFFWDAAEESLGIGTSSPAQPIEILKTSAGAVVPMLQLRNGSSTAGSGTSIKFMHSTVSNATSGTCELESIRYSGNLGALTFKTSNNGGTVTERMRVDGTGVLVGTTDDAVWTNSANSAADNGHNLRYDGRAGFAYYNATAGANATVNVNRTGSDGDLIRLFKSGTTVGSIGAYTGYTRIGGNTNGGLIFRNGNISPWNNSGGAYADGTQDLGATGAAFKDLYLSGGAYLGGTAAANLLDDYEEGTWTPVYLPSSGSFTTLTMDVVHATYTKVGNLVTAKAFIRTDDVDVTGASGSLYLSGLPFTPTYYESVFLDYAIGWTGQAPISGHTQQGSAYINLLYRDTADANNETSQVSDMTDGTQANRNRLMITAVYQTAA